MQLLHCIGHSTASDKSMKVRTVTHTGRSKEDLEAINVLRSDKKEFSRFARGRRVWSGRKNRPTVKVERY